jgi:hypothetical protein
VDALHRFAVLQVGLAGAFDGEPAPQRVDDLVERVALGAGADRAALLGLLELANWRSASVRVSPPVAFWSRTAPMRRLSLRPSTVRQRP